MAIKWEKWDPDRIPPRDLLKFRNRVLEIKSEPSPEELHAMKMHLAELAHDRTLYNLVAMRDGKITAWMNGKFSESRLTDIIRTLFFDHKALSSQEIDDLLYQLEASLPHPFNRIEIHGLISGREQTTKLVRASGYSPAYKVGYFQRNIEKARPSIVDSPRLDFEHTIYMHTAYDIYRNAFSPTWERDLIQQAELAPILETSDPCFSFIAYMEESPAGLVVTNKGLSEEDVYLQIIAVQPRMRGQGIADKMMNYLEQNLVSEGVKTISLATYVDNKPMMQFLERWEFQMLYSEIVLFKEEIAHEQETPGSS